MQRYYGQEYMRLVLVDEQGTKFEAVAYGRHSNRLHRFLVEGRSYDFLRVNFAPTEVDALSHIFRLCQDYYVVLSPGSIVRDAARSLWIAQCPRTFREFEDVTRQRANTFADVIGLVVYVADVVDRESFRSRPSRRVVILNDRINYLIINVRGRHLERHIWEWRSAASELKTMAALHVKVESATDNVTTTDYSELVLSPIGAETDILREFRIWLQAEDNQLQAHNHFEDMLKI